MKKDNFKIDFMGVGVQKGATTWIWKCLKEHPQVCDWGGKEIHFFNKQKTKFHPVKRCRYEQEGMEGYKKIFKSCSSNKLIGEWSPHYMVDKSVAPLIKKHFPNVKILTSLRNPIERAYSQYFHVLSESGKDLFGSFEEAIEKESEFIEKGFYYKQLKPYFDLFPKENILVLIKEDIDKNPKDFIQKIYKFLGIEKSFVPSSLDKKISPKEVKQSWIYKIIRNNLFSGFRKSSFGKKIVENKHIRKLFDNFINFYFRKTNFKILEMKKGTRMKLREIYKEDIKNLEKLINKDLSFWK